MMEPVTIARPYAEAVFKMACGHEGLARWSEMLALIEIVVTDVNIAPRIGDPNVNSAALERAIIGILGDRLDGYGRNLVQMLVQNQRLELIPHIRALYEEFRRRHDRVLEAKIISAFPVGEDQLRALVTAVQGKYSQRVDARVQVDPTLIGGVRIVVGDRVIDASVRASLDAMAAALAA